MVLAEVGEREGLQTRQCSWWPLHRRRPCLPPPPARRKGGWGASLLLDCLTRTGRPGGTCQTATCHTRSLPGTLLRGAGVHTRSAADPHLSPHSSLNTNPTSQSAVQPARTAHRVPLAWGGAEAQQALSKAAPVVVTGHNLVELPTKGTPLNLRDGSNGWAMRV